MTREELNDTISRVQKTLNPDAVAHACEYIRRRWAVNERFWFGISLMAFVAGLVVGIFVWTLLNT